MGGLCGASLKWAMTFVVAHFILSLINPSDQTGNTPAPGSDRKEMMTTTVETREIARTTMTAHRGEVPSGGKSNPGGGSTTGRRKANDKGEQEEQGQGGGGGGSWWRRRKVKEEEEEG